MTSTCMFSLFAVGFFVSVGRLLRNLTCLNILYYACRARTIPFFGNLGNFGYRLPYFFFSLAQCIEPENGYNKSWFALILQQKKFRIPSSKFSFFWDSAVSYWNSHFVWFDTVCFVFSICYFVYTILTSIGRAALQWILRSSIYLPMFLFWFREWIISIFMSFSAHVFIFNFFFVCSFIYLFISLLSLCLR